MSRDSARGEYKQLCRANTGTDTSEQSAKVSRSSSHSRGSSSRPIYNGGEKTRYRSETRLPIDGDTGDRGSFALDSLETSGRTFGKLERHITSISLFARFSSDKRQSRAVDCL